MSNVYDYYINFTINTATAGQDISYLNKIVYVAYSESDKENYVVVYSKKEVEDLNWLDEKEKEIIAKAFELGLSSLYIRGAINEEWGSDNILPLSQFKLKEKVLDVQNLAFTMVISPRWKAQKSPIGFNGVLVNSIAEIPTEKPAENIINVFDTYLNEESNKMDFDGKALGIMTLFLSGATFSNMQLKSIKGYNAIEPTGLVKTLKDTTTTFIFNDGINDLLGMFAVGGKAVVHPYISELWRYNVREALRVFLQVQNPTYTDSDILVIEDIVNRVCDNFVTMGYFIDYKKTVAPIRENQLASDIDAFLVNNVKVEYNTISAVWTINIDVKE